MSKIFQNIKLQNNVHRNAFDLSYRHVTSAPVGALLPIMCKEVLPSDRFQIGMQHLTRTMPLNTATFARMTEYFHFFFVPTRLLDQDFQTKVMDNVEPHFRMDDTAKKFPVFSTQTMFKSHYSGGDTSATLLRDMFGYSTLQSAIRLMSMLNYPSLPYFKKEEITEIKPLPGIGVFGPDGRNMTVSVTTAVKKLSGLDSFVSPYKLAGYQRIFQDFYRNSVWEQRNPKAYDCSYYSGMATNSTGYLLDGVSLHEMSTMRYAPLKRDFLTGMYPSQQFGAVSVTPLDTSVFTKETSTADNDNIYVRGRVGSNAVILDRNEVKKIGVSVLDIRRAEALQKYKEITMTAGKLYGDQVKAHYDQSVSDTRQQVVEFLGGTSSVINIDEVISQAQTRNGESGADLGDISGKGISASNKGHLVDFTAQEHGFIYCIYHCQPLVDYSSNNLCLNSENNKFSVDDYAIPEMDSIGFEPHYMYEFIASEVDQPLPASKTSVIGYTPRYMSYKTSLDMVSGGMLSPALKPWTIQLDAAAIAKNSNYYRYVSPQVVKDVFVQDYDGTTLTDHLIMDIFFDVKAVRPLSVYGLPY